jgi:hypothetical protein
MKEKIEDAASFALTDAYPDSSGPERTRIFGAMLDDIAADSSALMRDWGIGASKFLGVGVKSTEAMSADDIKDAIQFIIDHREEKIVIASHEEGTRRNHWGVAKTMMSVMSLSCHFMPTVGRIKHEGHEALCALTGTGVVIAMTEGFLSSMMRVMGSVTKVHKPTYKCSDALMVTVVFPGRDQLDEFDKWQRSNVIIPMWRECKSTMVSDAMTALYKEEDREKVMGKLKDITR